MTRGSAGFCLASSGWARARRLLLRNERLTAGTAQEWGIFDEVWDDADFLEKTMALAHHFAEGPTLALSRVRSMLWSGMDNSFEDQLRFEAEQAASLSAPRM